MRNLPYGTRIDGKVTYCGIYSIYLYPGAPYKWVDPSLHMRISFVLGYTTDFDFEVYVYSIWKCAFPKISYWETLIRAEVVTSN